MAALSVEHLKVRVYLLGGGVNSRACLRILMVEHLKVLISRAPKGDGGQSSMLTHPYQSSP